MFTVPAGKNVFRPDAVGGYQVVEQFDGRLPFRITVKRVNDQEIDPEFRELRLNLSDGTDVGLGFAVRVEIAGGPM